MVRCAERDRLLAHLAMNGVQTMVHYPIPPHRQQAYSGEFAAYFPLTDAIHAEVLSLPIGPVMTDGQVGRVVDVINAFA